MNFNHNKILRVVLWLLAAILVLVLASCTAGSGDGKPTITKSAAPAQWTKDRPMRLLLGGSRSGDSARGVAELAVDQALRQACDSIPQAKFLTLNYRDSLAGGTRDSAGKPKGIPVAELGRDLKLDGVIFTTVARFGGVIAVNLRIVEPKTGNTLFRDVSYSIVRYRDTAGTLYLGPALFDAVRKSLGKFFGLKHTDSLPVATVPIVISSVTIPNDSSLGQLRRNRGTLARTAIRAVGDYGMLHYPELVAFDYDGRNEVFKLARIAAVDDYDPVSDLERKALFSVGIDRYVTASVAGLGRDSVQLRMEIHGVVSPLRDTLIDSQQSVQPKTRFENARVETEFTVAMIDLAEPLFKREGDRVRAEYEQQLLKNRSTH